MSKIVFIEPQSPNLHIFSRFKLPRLGIFILGSLMKQRGWKVEIFFEEISKLNWETIKSADIVGISTISSTAPRAYKIADKIRSLGIPVILGGPHVSFLPEEALKHGDYVVRGEGEFPLMKFVDSFESSKDFRDVPNLSYKNKGKAIHNPKGKFVPKLDELPYPDFSLLNGGTNKLLKGGTIPVQTSRGCPYNCSFCSVTPMFGRKYRYRSVENILDELSIYERRGNFIFFYDDHFAANPIHTKKLLRAIINEKLNIRWSAQVRADIAKDSELITLMKKAGCHTVFIGFESVNPVSLKSINKNLKVSDLNNAVKVFHKNRIHIHGMFMLGLDDDNWKTVKQTLNFAKKSDITSSQFLILTPLPGSRLFNEIKSENRIVFNDWSLYDAHHVVFKPRNFTLKSLQYAQIYSHKKFYSIYNRVKKLLKGDFIGVIVNKYARNLNHIWQKKNVDFLKKIATLPY